MFLGLCSLPAKSSMDAALESMHTRMYALIRWRMYRKHLSESLEQLASYNRADMYKYNMLYTLNVNLHVLTQKLYYKDYFTPNASARNSVCTAQLPWVLYSFIRSPLRLPRTSELRLLSHPNIAFASS